MNYYVREINSCESRILDKIDIIKRYGIDTDEYEQRLKEILNSETEDVDYSMGGTAVKNMQNDMTTMNMLKSLQELEEQLNSHQKFLSIHFKNNSLLNEISKMDNFSEEKMDYYIKNAISNISETYNLDIKSVKESKKIITDVYYTAYEIIKLELIKNNNSKLLDYIIKNGGVEYINDFVREDLNKIEKNKLMDDNIQDTIYELSKECINYNFADPKLIKYIVLKSDDRLLKVLEYDLIECDEKEDKYSKLNSKYYDKLRTNTREKDKLDTKRNHNRIKSIIGAIILALNIGAYKSAPGVVRNANTTTSYDVTTEAYDTVSGKTRSEKINFDYKDNEYVTVKVYGEVDSRNKRDVVKYNLSDVELEDIEDYVEAVSEHNNASSRTNIDYSFGEQLSRDEYTVVERVKQIDENVNFDEEAYNRELRIANIILYATGGTISAFTLYSLLSLLNNRKKIKKNCLDSNGYGKLIDKNDDKIREYRNLKKEVESMIEDYNNGQIDYAEYEKLTKKLK